MWQPGFEPGNAAAPADADRLATGTSPARPDDAPADGEHVEIVLDGPAIEPPPEAARAARSGWRRWRTPIAAVTIAGLAVGTVLVIRQRAETERAATEPVAGADQRRLASSADRLWTTTINLTDDIIGEQPVRLTQFILADRSAVVAFLPAADDTSLAVGLNALTGDELWRRPFDFDATTVNILGVLNDTAIFEQNDLDGRRLIGVDVVTGATNWELPTRDNGVHVILAGTSVITRVSFTGDARLTFIDPATGPRCGGFPATIRSSSAIA